MKNKLSLALALLLSMLLSPAQSQTCFHDCEIASNGLILIKNAEGFSPFIYRDSVGIPTIGFGHVIQPGDDITQPLMGPEAVELLMSDIRVRTEKINTFIDVPLTHNQFDALTSFAYNLGTGTLQRSTLLKKINENQNDQVHDQFLRYTYAGGKMLKGLRIRREAEARLYDSDK